MTSYKQAARNFGIVLVGVVLGATLPAVAEHGHDRDNDEKHQPQHEEHARQDQHHDQRAHEVQRHDERVREVQRHDNGPAEPQRHGPPPSAERHDQGRPHDHAEYRPVMRTDAPPGHAMHPGGHDDWQRARARHWGEEHRSWHARGGYHGYHIPPERFRAHFGHAHWFSVRTVPVVVVGGHPRFHYGGFWFTLVDPWPEVWAATWYQTDDVYIDYVNDGYYMYNRSHPGVAISVNVSL